MYLFLWVFIVFHIITSIKIDEPVFFNLTAQVISVYKFLLSDLSVEQICLKSSNVYIITFLNMGTLIPSYGASCFI